MPGSLEGAFLCDQVFSSGAYRSFKRPVGGDWQQKLRCDLKPSTRRVLSLCYQSIFDPSNSDNHLPTGPRFGMSRPAPWLGFLCPNQWQHDQRLRVYLTYLLVLAEVRSQITRV